MACQLIIQLLRTESVVMANSCYSWKDVVIGDLLIGISVEDLLLEYLQLVFHLWVNVPL